MSDKPQDLQPRAKAFALRVIRMYSDLPKGDTLAQVLGKQVLRSGTSVGANYARTIKGGVHFQDRPPYNSSCAN